MAFVLRRLSVLAYAQGFTLWHYDAAPDELETVGRDGFFDPANSLLRHGDMLLISAADGGRASVVQAAGGGIATLRLA